MQAADIILGLLIIILVGWTVMQQVQQQALWLTIQGLEAKQVAQGIQISPNKCQWFSDRTLVKATEIEENEYLTTVGFDIDLNQIYFCFYEK